MSLFSKNYITIVLLIAILGIGFFMRNYNYQSIPRHGATFDEFAWTWLGVNLIQTGTPVSWSSQPQYKDREHLRYQGAAFWLVRPYLEHPPLFGLAAGGFALLNGARDMYDVTLSNMRPLALILGAMSILMVFIFMREIYSRNIAMLAAALYATIPTLVIGSRIVQNENFLIPFWLLSLYLTARYIKTRKKWLRNLAAVIAGLLSLAKVPWLVVGLSLSMILSYNGKWKDAFFVGGVTLLIFSSFLIYASYFDRELFFNLMGLQIARYDISFSGMFAIFRDPLLVDRAYLDGWIFFGWFAIFLLLKNFKEHIFILIPFLAYLVLFIFAIPNEPSHGWYRYPFIPFLVGATALVLKDEIKKISPLSLIFLFVVGLSLLFNTWEAKLGFSYTFYRLFIILAAASVLIPLWFKRYAKISRHILLGWIIIFLILNCIAAVSYLE